MIYQACEKEFQQTQSYITTVSIVSCIWPSLIKLWKKGIKLESPNEVKFKTDYSSFLPGFSLKWSDDWLHTFSWTLMHKDIIDERRLVLPPASVPRSVILLPSTPGGWELRQKQATTSSLKSWDVKLCVNSNQKSFYFPYLKSCTFTHFLNYPIFQTNFCLPWRFATLIGIKINIILLINILF